MNAGWIIPIVFVFWIAVALLLRNGAWLFNRVYNLATPGRGERGNVDHTLYQPARSTAHKMPPVLARYHARPEQGMGLPVLPTATAVLVSLGLVLAHVAAGWLLWSFLRLAGDSAGVSAGGMLLLLAAVGLPLSVLISSAVLRGILDCKIQRAVIFTLTLWTLLGMLILVVAIVTGIAFAWGGYDLNWRHLRETLF